MLKTGERTIAVFILVIIGSFLLSSCAQPPVDYSSVAVLRVSDGDTIEIESGEKVRFIGIDCPELFESDKQYRQAESWHMDIRTLREIAQKAASYTSSLVYGRRVRLEFDAELYDKYDRLLAYVYLPDGAMVNELILRKGYADLLTIPPNVKHREVFKQALEEAQLNEQGMWGE